jgi:hypothetical protein
MAGLPRIACLPVSRGVQLPNPHGEEARSAVSNHEAPISPGPYTTTLSRFAARVMPV